MQAGNFQSRRVGRCRYVLCVTYVLDTYIHIDIQLLCCVVLQKLRGNRNRTKLENRTRRIEKKICEKEQCFKQRMRKASRYIIIRGYHNKNMEGEKQ